MFYILDQERITKSKGTFENFKEGLIQETCNGDLTVLVLVEQKSRSLAGWINNQWVAVISFEHDCILGRQIISWQRFPLPAQTVVSRRKVFRQGQLRFELDTSFRQMVRPLLPHD